MAAEKKRNEKGRQLLGDPQEKRKGAVKGRVPDPTPGEKGEPSELLSPTSACWAERGERGKGRSVRQGRKREKEIMDGEVHI